MENYNSQYFSSEDRKRGKDIEFIKCLLNLDLSEHFNDLHIYEEEGAVIVEWVERPYTREYGGTFQFVDEDEQVMTEIIYPDNSSEWVPEGSEDDCMTVWLKLHPEWEKNEFGIWTKYERKQIGTQDNNQYEEN